MYPYEIQHRRGELLEIRGDTNISLSILVVKHGIYIWTYNVMRLNIKMKEPLTISFDMLQYYGNNLPLS